MRWKIKPKKTPIALHTQRHKIKLALWTKITEDGYTIWLENYLSVEEYCSWLVGAPQISSIATGWKEKERWSQASTMWNEWFEKI